MSKLPNFWTDRFGAVASSLCALHCAVCALLPTIFAALGVGFLLTHEAEWFLNIVAILFGAFALRLTRKTHRSRQVMVFLCVGIVGLLIGRGLEMAADHGHHGGEHDAHAEVGDHHEDGHHDDGEKAEQEPDHEEHGHEDEEAEHADGHDDHAEGDGLHMLGAGVGVLSGLLLFFGHLLNLRNLRRRHGESGE